MRLRFEREFYALKGSSTGDGSQGDLLVASTKLDWCGASMLRVRTVIVFMTATYIGAVLSQRAPVRSLVAEDSGGDCVSSSSMDRRHACMVFCIAAASLVGCATPSAPDPRGKWMPVNRFADAPQAIPLNQSYVYQASPADGTLKTMLTRWARDSRMTLSYLHPNDYTLYGPVGSVRTPSLAEAVAALTSAYASENVVVVVDRGQIVVSRASQAGGSGAAPVAADLSAAGQ